MDPSVIDGIKQRIVDQFSNPDLCQDIKDELKGAMKDKCPDPILFDSTYSKEILSNIEKTKEIIKILEESAASNDDCNPLSQAVPNMFNNEKTGQLGLLSSKNNKPTSQDFILDRYTETLYAPNRATVQPETSGYYANVSSDSSLGFDKYLGLISLFSFPLVDLLISKGEDNKGIFLTIDPITDASQGFSVDNEYLKVKYYYSTKQGTRKMENVYVNNKQIADGFEIPSDSYSPGIESLLNGATAKSLEQTVAKEDLVFYELVQKYFSDYVAGGTKIVLYFVTQKVIS